MKLSDIKKRVDELAATSQPATGELAHEQFQSALSLMVALYGEGTSQVKSLIRDKDTTIEKYGPVGGSEPISHFAIAAFRNLKAEIDAGLIGSLEKSIAGEVLADFVALARHVLDEGNTDASKNVAAVLAAAAFEDTLRRLGKTNSIPHIEKLADLLDELKGQKILQGSQVTIASGYLSFRNRAMHAQWDMVDRASVASVLGFVEQIILAHF